MHFEKITKVSDKQEGFISWQKQDYGQLAKE